MDVQNQMLVQIAIDFALFVAIMILLWRVNSNLRKSPADSHKEMTAELRALIIESQANADKFLQALEQSRLALKEIALELDIKEKRVKSLLEKNGRENPALNPKPPVSDFSSSQNKYSEVMDLIHKGHSEEETANMTGCTQAEVGFIMDLSRIKKENA